MRAADYIFSGHADEDDVEVSFIPNLRDLLELSVELMNILATRACCTGSA